MARAQATDEPERLLPTHATGVKFEGPIVTMEQV
jgi:hypothetical protein